MVRSGQSLLQHFDGFIMCWLCVSGEILKTEQSMGHQEMCVNFIPVLSFETYFAPSYIDSH